ncbi:MAG: pentapeptide repeat-containing protein [Planctomycetota bacterium]|jgi:hypothetical protein
MPTPDHEQLVRSGDLRRWRSDNPKVQLNLDDIDLAGLKLDLSGCQIAPASLRRARLARIDLRGADLNGVDLAGALLARADLRKADLRYSNLHDADLSNCDLRQCDFEGANLAQCNLTHTDLSAANFSKSTLTGANLFNAYWTSPPESIETACVHEHVTDHILRSDTCEWRRLDRLFGASYSVLILVPLLIFVIAGINAYVIEPLHSLAQHVLSVQGETLPSWATKAAEIAASVEPLSAPHNSVLLLCSATLLAIASTLFATQCPSRVKEFTRDYWCDVLGNELLQYTCFSWRYTPVRITSAACYLLGGAGALWVLATKLYYAIQFILEH